VCHSLPQACWMMRSCASYLRAVLTSAAESPLGLIIVWRLYGECDEINLPLVLGGWGEGKERTDRAPC
jgi:hypothetical protein